MALPALVLVHGGGLAADCWDLTVEEIHRQAPELDVLAVDLPGDIVVVGHSLAGLTLPGVVTKLSASRVREMVLATAFVPPEGTAVVDTLTGPLAPLARRNAKKGGASKTPSVSARFVYFNGIPRAQRRDPHVARPCSLAKITASQHRRPRRGADGDPDRHLPNADGQ